LWRSSNRRRKQHARYRLRVAVTHGCGSRWGWLGITAGWHGLCKGGGPLALAEEVTMDSRDVRRAVVAAAVGAWTTMTIGCAGDDCRDGSTSALSGSLELYSEGYAATIGNDEPVSARFYLLGGQDCKGGGLGDGCECVSTSPRLAYFHVVDAGCEDGSCTVGQISAPHSASTSDIVLTIVPMAATVTLRVDAESEPDYDGSTWPASAELLLQAFPAP
jgi:hypothetical protein